jgi:hypothetical protein
MLVAIMNNTKYFKYSMGTTFFLIQILQKLLHLDQIQEQRDSRHFSVGPMINITVRRNYLYEDAFEKLSPENGKLLHDWFFIIPDCMW